MKLLLNTFKNRNIFSLYLKLLKVRHTRVYSNVYFNEHPHKYNLFGLSQMLLAYGVENVGIKVNDKHIITSLETPFIAQLLTEFVLVYKVTENFVFYIWNGRKVHSDFSGFFRAWTGVILIAEVSKASIEPAYKEHRKRELFNILSKSILIILVIISCLLVHVFLKTVFNIGNICL